MLAFGMERGQRVKKYQHLKWCEIVGQEFSLGSRSIACRESKACRKVRQNRDEAAAKNECHPRCDKENRSEGKNGLEPQLVGQ